MSGFLIFIIVLVIAVIIHVVILKFRPNILSDVRAKIPKKVSIVIPPKTSDTTVHDTDEAIALLKEQLRTGTAT